MTAAKALRESKNRIRSVCGGEGLDSHRKAAGVLSACNLDYLSVAFYDSGYGQMFGDQQECIRESTCYAFGVYTLVRVRGVGRVGKVGPTVSQMDQNS